MSTATCIAAAYEKAVAKEDVPGTAPEVTRAAQPASEQREATQSGRSTSEQRAATTART